MLASASLGINAVSQAAANFSEGFDSVGPTTGAGPQNLINQGWIFRNQSQPAGVTVWRQGRNYSFPCFTPQGGSGYLANWALLLGKIPDTGRLAIRWYEPPLPSFQSPFIGVDTLVVGPPPCNAPTMPPPGQTVTWTAADSSYHICGDAAISASATVIVKPGVSITVAAWEFRSF
jgi:hypothetical protein